MQRLASSLAEAQGKRELAEEGKRTVENEVDDLAASLFQQVRLKPVTASEHRSDSMTPFICCRRPIRWSRRSGSRGLGPRRG